MRRRSLLPALGEVLLRRRDDGRWAANAGYPGETHVTYARTGQPNPWVTLRARRVLRATSGLVPLVGDLPGGARLPRSTGGQGGR